MTVGFYAKVPKDLADRLIADGFREAGSPRGIETAIADGANLVTVLIGAHEISRFIGHLWTSMRHDKPVPDQSGSKVIIEHDGQSVAFTLEHRGFGDDGPPKAVVAGMTALLEELSKPGWRNSKA
jgi:hypothetical protein